MLAANVNLTIQDNYSSVFMLFQVQPPVWWHNNSKTKIPGKLKLGMQINQGIRNKRSVLEEGGGEFEKLKTIAKFVAHRCKSESNLPAVRLNFYQ